MKRLSTIFIAYAPILLLVTQIVFNLLYWLNPSLYVNLYFYLGWGVGGSMFLSALLVAITERFRFCEVSKWAARAQVAFSLIYFFIRQDNIYNISLQIVIGLVAIIITMVKYKERFPFCRLSLFLNFMRNIFKERSCEKGLEAHERQVKNLILKKHYRHENSKHQY